MGSALSTPHPYWSRLAPERRADQAADQSESAAQEWENPPSRTENRVHRKRAKAHSLVIQLSSEQQCS